MMGLHSSTAKCRAPKNIARGERKKSLPRSSRVNQYSQRFASNELRQTQKKMKTDKIDVSRFCSADELKARGWDKMIFPAVKTLTESERNIAEHVATHEAGHAVVGNHYGLCSLSCGRILSIKDETGVCHVDGYGKGSAFARAVTTWAGVVADEIRYNKGGEVDLEWFYKDFIDNGESITEKDWLYIVACGQNNKQALKRAHDILRRKWELVESVAKAIIEDYATGQTPELFQRSEFQVCSPRSPKLV